MINTCAIMPRIYGLKTVVFRQSCIYGTRQFGIEDQGWVAWFCVAAATGQPFSIFGDGKQIRDALWVGDLVDCYERALERLDEVRGEVFNVGGGPANTLSLRELVSRLEHSFGRALRPAYADWRPGDQRVFVADVRKAERLLGWRPRVGIAEGVELDGLGPGKSRPLRARDVKDSGTAARDRFHGCSMKSMRICHLGKYYPPAPGGIETHTRTLARQVELGARVQVFCVNHEGGPTAFENDGGVKVTRFGRVGSALEARFLPRADPGFTARRRRHPASSGAQSDNDSGAFGRAAESAWWWPIKATSSISAPRGVVPTAGTPRVSPGATDPAEQPELFRRVAVLWRMRIGFMFCRWAST